VYGPKVDDVHTEPVCLVCLVLRSEQPSDGERTHHALDNSGRSVARFDIANGTQEIGHDVTRTSEIEVCHVYLVEGYAWLVLVCNGEQIFSTINHLSSFRGTLSLT
jgi:hypothetical protein